MNADKGKNMGKKSQNSYLRLSAPIRGFLLVVFLLAASPLLAAGRVELELVGDSRGGAALGFQQWMQALSRAGIKNFRIRTAQSGDTAKIDVQGTDQSPVYLVTGLITSQDEIVVPGGRFKRGNAAGLARWLDDLAEHGPPNRREAKSAFGLTAKQLERVHDDLARPVGFSTAGMTPGAALEKIARRLSLPVELAGDLPARSDEKIAEELSGLSCGTALACLLRPAGFCLVPRQTGRGLVYAVAEARLGQEVWPVGWPPEKPPIEALPSLFEFHNVNVQNVPAAKLLDTISAMLKVPVLMDHNALARHGIDPTKAMVAMPQAKTTYGLALRKLLFKAGLKFEVRVDEAGKPFLWVSTVKPV
jgi:hypothetical protein